MVAVTNDVLAGDKADEFVIIVHHRDKVLTAGHVDQILHQAGGRNRSDMTTLGDLADADVFSSLQIQIVALFDDAQDIALGQSPYIAAVTVKNRDGGVAVILHLFQGLTQGKIIVNKVYISFGGQKKQYIHVRLLIGGEEGGISFMFSIR